MKGFLKKKIIYFFGQGRTRPNHFYLGRTCRTRSGPVKSEKILHCSLYKTVETATNDAEEEGGGWGWHGGGGVVVDGGSKWRCCGVRRWFLLFPLLFLGVFSSLCFPLSVSFCFCFGFSYVLLSLSSLCLFYFVLLASSLFFYLPPILSSMFVFVVFLSIPLLSPPFPSSVSSFKTVLFIPLSITSLVFSLPLTACWTGYL